MESNFEKALHISNKGTPIASKIPQTEKIGKLEIYSQRYDSSKMYTVLLCNENIYQLFSITRCWLKAQAMILEATVCSDKNLLRKAQIKLAKGVEHRFSEIAITFGKMMFGEENVLLPCRNIARKDVLKNEDDRESYIELRNLLSKKIEENELVSLIGFDESYLTKEFKERITDFEPKSAKSDGVCYSACMYLIGKLLNEPEINEDVLIHHAKELEEGVPAKVAAIQEIYHELKFNDNKRIELQFNETSKSIRATFCNNITDIIYERALAQGAQIPVNFANEIHKVVNNAVEGLEIYNQDLSPAHRITSSVGKTISRDTVLQVLNLDNLTDEYRKSQYSSINGAAYRNVNPEIQIFLKEAIKGLKLSNYKENYKRSTIAHLYGFKQDFEGCNKIESLLGGYANKCSSLEHLKDLGLLEPGIYQTIFNTSETSHAVLYIKTAGGQGYLFEPNYGLIKCDENNHAITYLKMLSMYPPPSTRLENENDDRNYRVQLTKFNKSMLDFSAA